MIAVWESDISAIYLIIRLKWSTDTAGFEYVIHQHGLAVREASFQIIGAWFG